jgi:D-lactate dehydrogenase (cytochrome)
VRSSIAVKIDYPEYLNDESGLISNGNAEKIFFPESENELIEIVKMSYSQKTPITISGGGTGISGGRVPLNGWIIATDNLTCISAENANDKFQWSDQSTGKSYELELIIVSENEARFRVPVSISVKEIQNFCKEHGWFYPPDPTERTAYIGGNVATNASGARSFKYGSTRNWIQSLRITLIDGTVLHLTREDVPIGTNHTITLNDTIKVPRPTYNLPNTFKNVVGPVITDDSQPIDLFIGTEGIFGIITEVELRLIKAPKFIISMFIFVEDFNQAKIVSKLANERRKHQKNPIPMTVEYLDHRALKIMRSKDNTISDTAKGLIIIEQDVNSQEELDIYLEKWFEDFSSIGIEDISVAQLNNEIEHHKYLRHLVPESINMIARMNKQPKLGTDYSAPIDKMDELFDYAMKLGEKFENELSLSKNEFGYIFWSHFGDNHVHLNLLPQTNEQRELAKSMFKEFMEQIVSWNGSIAAEHGLGKKEFNGKPVIYIQLGEQGVNEILKMKKILDPDFLLNRGNLIGYQETQ